MRDILNLSFRLVKFVTVEVNSLYLEGQTLVCIEVLIQGLKVGSNYLGWASSPRLTGSRHLYYQLASVLIFHSAFFAVGMKQE